MLALTLWQPWAHIVVHGGKRIENRTWAPSMRQVPIGTRFALHASKHYDMPSATAIQRDHHGHVVCPKKEETPLGAVIGVATLVDILRHRDEVERRVPDQLRWWMGPVGLLLADVVAVQPVACAGSRGFWYLSADVNRKVAAQVES